jgi:tellurite methyltransferase
MGKRTWSPWGGEYRRTPDRYVFGRDASTFAREILRLLRPRARVLDLGCGEGRDSVFFASRGCQVTGVEMSLEGLRKAERLAAERGVRPRWVCGSLADLPVAGRFDLVYSCGSVHYVARAARARLFRRLRALTAPGGYQAHLVFTDRRVHPEKGERIDYFAPGELERLYAGWAILKSAEGVIPCAQDGTAHLHSVAVLVGRRTGAVSATRRRSRRA